MKRGKKLLGTLQTFSSVWACQQLQFPIHNLMLAFGSTTFRANVFFRRVRDVVDFFALCALSCRNFTCTTKKKSSSSRKKKHFWNFLSSRLDETASKIRLFDLHSHEIREAIRGANGSRLLPQSVLVAWREWKEERKPNNNNTRDEPTKLSRKWQKKIRENFSYWKQKKKRPRHFLLHFD